MPPVAVGTGRLNKVKKNPRVGQSYHKSALAISRKGTEGTYHTYAGGRKVFVRKPAPKAQVLPQPIKPIQSPVAPQAQPGVAAPHAGQSTVDYRDSSYFEDKAMGNRDVQVGLAQLDAEEQTIGQTRAEALRRLMAQRPEDLQRADQNFNKSGLFYSGQLGKARDDIESGYVRQQADMNAGYDDQLRRLVAARRSLQQQAEERAAAAAEAAAGRGIERDGEAADANALAGPGASVNQLASPVAATTARVAAKPRDRIYNVAPKPKKPTAGVQRVGKPTTKTMLATKRAKKK